MSKQPKQWMLAADPPAPYIAALQHDLGPIMAKVLYNRGLVTAEKARQFIRNDYELPDPFLMKDMGKAVARIRQAIRQRERIVVYGDFDADGVTSTAVMIQTLLSLGADATPYIPDRADEGYGLNIPALQMLAQQGYRLVITVDCGIRSIEEVKAANELGLDIIITDHHSVGEQLPPAYAILNPKRVDCPYPEDMLAGVGIAFKLACALIAAGQKEPPTTSLLPIDLLDLVAIGTVADLAPLDRLENRKIVQLGLQELMRAKRPGIYALMDISRIRPEKMNSTSIGYALGPRINAAGRLEKAIIAYQLLMTDDWREANQLAKELQDINTRRQQLTTEAHELARQLAVQNGHIPSMLFAAHESFLPGIVGLVAGRLTEEFYRPSVVIEIGEQESHGSCRSTPEFNITHALDRCADLLLQHGGHAQAAGFTIMNQNIPLFKERLEQLITQQLSQYELCPTLVIDAQVNLVQLTMDLAKKIQLLEPIGTDNPEPIFCTRHLRVVEAQRVGSEGKHLKMRLADGPISMDAIAFRFGDWLNDLTPYIDVAYNLQINEWNRRTSPQMNIVDIHLL
ncbi:MAG: single-stranded-DNA-specific exonuclease RecJ [Phototrophicales bacterium]|nr:MAG: single-stranded-DNA-specific exonuclease RecJ [Phototrophicales bacterium]